MGLLAPALPPNSSLQKELKSAHSESWIAIFCHLWTRPGNCTYAEGQARDELGPIFKSLVLPGQGIELPTSRFQGGHSTIRPLSQCPTLNLPAVLAGAQTMQRIMRTATMDTLFFSNKYLIEMFILHRNCTESITKKVPLGINVKLDFMCFTCYIIFKAFFSLAQTGKYLLHSAGPDSHKSTSGPPGHL